MSLSQPLLPYAGTSGWSGSETSRERAITEDRNGKTKVRQILVLNTLRHNGERGLTWKDVSEIFNYHHGQASGVLSVLHKEGLIVRLKQRRNKCLIYVAPEFIAGREISERKVKKCRHCGGAL